MKANEVKTNRIIFIAVALAVRTLASEVKLPSMIVAGNCFSNVTIARVEDQNAVCFHSKGVLRTPLETLPPLVLAEVEKVFPEARPPKPVARQSENEIIPGIPLIQVENDEFENKTKYTFSYAVSLLHAADEVQRSGDFYYLIKAFVDNKTKAITLIISFGYKWSAEDNKNTKPTSLREMWPHSQSRSMILLVDEERIDLGNYSYSNDINSRGKDKSYIEWMWSPISMKTLIALYEGRKVRVRLGEDDITLMPKDRVYMKTMYMRLMKDFPDGFRGDDK